MQNKPACLTKLKSIVLACFFAGIVIYSNAQSCQGSLLFDANNPGVFLPSSNQYYTGVNGGYTWECWFRLTQPFGSDVRPLINSIDLVLFEDMWLGFGWQGGWYNEPVTQLVFKVDGPNSTAPTGPNCSYAPAGGFQLNTWYHAAGVMNYTAQLATLYLNGQPVDSKTITTPPNTRVIPTELSYNWSGSPAPLYGNMDEVRIWTRPRTAAEILTNYTLCVSANDPYLLAYYRCNQQNGTTVMDATPASNTGTFVALPGWSTLDVGVTGTACAGSNALGVAVNSAVICPGNSATITATAGSSFTWNTGANTSSIVVSPTVTTNYTVSGLSGCTGSLASAYTTVSVVPVPTVVVTGNKILCHGTSLVLTASGAGSYSWSTGGSLPTVTLSPASTTTYSVKGTNGGACSATATITVFVSECTGVTEVPLRQKLSAYPNPTQGMLTIEALMPATLIITSVAGQELLRQDLSAGNNTVDLSGLASGIYFGFVKNSGALKIIRE